MKKITLMLSLCLIIPAMLHSQDREMKRLFEKYAKVEGFKLEKGDFDLDIDLNDDFSKFLNSVDALYILKFDKENGDLSGLNVFVEKLKKQISKKGFENMLEINSEGSIKILIRKNNRDEPTDYLLLTSGDKAAMFLWAG